VRKQSIILLVAALVLVPLVSRSSLAAEPFRVLSWNVESNRPNQSPVSDKDTIASQLTDLMKQPATRAGIVALSEVEPRTFDAFQKAIAVGLGSEVDYVTSASGGFQDYDSLMIIVDKSRFEMLDVVELHRHGGISANFNVSDETADDFGTLRARSPLAARIKDKSTNQTFWFIANHLARGEAELRTDQAKMLSQWAVDTKEPAITAGDFNFDFDFKTQQGNDGFKAMMASGVWQWLKPDPLLDSNWSDDRSITDRRVDRYPDSILDFVFVANGAKNWQGESDVVVREGDFPDNDKTSDHRPLITVFYPQ
jgi:endonuclease/exonuclease/phosphatase family metal-dependent hydrolase